jgi:hypothetical protein
MLDGAGFAEMQPCGGSHVRFTHTGFLMDVTDMNCSMLFKG